MGNHPKNAYQICVMCGEPFWARAYDIGRGGAKYCSRACSGKGASIASKTHGSHLVEGGWMETGRAKRKTPEGRLQERAHRMVIAAVKSGKLIRGPCEVCGAVKTHGHHEDYNAPLSVIWLCVKHHQQAHLELDAKSQ